jgi:hypothetical protein
VRSLCFNRNADVAPRPGPSRSVRLPCPPSGVMVVGMPGSVTSVFDGSDDFEAALRDEGNFSLFITAYGRLQARMTQIELHHLRLSAVEENLSLIGFLTVPAQTVLVAFPIGGRLSPIWSAIRPRKGEFMTFGPGYRMHMRTHGPCGWGSIWLPAHDLAAYFHDLTGDALAIPSAAHLWRPRQTHGRRLLQLHAAAIRAAQSRPETLVNADAAHGMEQQLFEVLVECLSAAPSDTLPQATHRHHRLAVQFEDLLRAQPDRPLRANELSAALGVSVYCARAAMRIWA